HGSPEGFRG
ncbi:hypothetical protein BN1723_019683, partial [Verticillium longisporum]